MKSFIKTLLFVGIGIGSFSYSAKLAHNEHLKRQDPEYKIVHYVQENLDTLIKEQEQKLNITYSGTPDIEVGIPEQTKKSFPKLSICGIYDSDANVIHLKKDILSLPDKEGLEVVTEDTCTIKTALDHELGHFYVDRLTEILGKGSWPQSLRETETINETAIHIIGEGIATYFERTMNNQYDNFKDKEWPTRLEDFFDPKDPAVPKYRFWYDGGYHLVKPIIDEFGVQGIEYLMFNPPTEEELTNIKDYQQNVLDQLRKR